MIIEKCAYPIADFDPENTSAIFEVARDSWPKLVGTETTVHEVNRDAVIYRGPADMRLYDEDDIRMMKESDTTTVVEDSGA